RTADGKTGDVLRITGAAAIEIRRAGCAERGVDRACQAIVAARIAEIVADIPFPARQLAAHPGRRADVEQLEPDDREKAVRVEAWRHARRTEQRRASRHTMRAGYEPVERRILPDRQFCIDDAVYVGQVRIAEYRC